MNSISPEPTWKDLYKVGGICFILVGISALLLIPIFAALGSSPATTEAYLKQLAGSRFLILCLIAVEFLKSVFLVPAVLGLYFALAPVSKTYMLLATAFWAIFIVMSFGAQMVPTVSQIGLSDAFVGAAGEAQWASILTQSNITQVLFNAGNLVTDFFLTLAFVITGLVMARGNFGRMIGYLGIVTGLTSQIGKIPGLTIGEVIFLVLAIVWFIATGVMLYNLAR